MTRSHLAFLPPARRAPRPALALATLLAVVLPALAGVNSARYRFEGNKRLSLDLSVDDVRAEEIKFEWPATLLRFKSGYKGTVKVANGSSRQAAVGIAVALYDQDGKLVGAGTTGSTIGTIDPGDSADFTLDFTHVTSRLEQASQFQIALEVR
ncbi:MAG TPA: FxLYD domain-containing protein [Candidatus Polarisedimenticolia bacterium]|nr:FxLYD domain-containing protein [Candidatus Polarisedimenticolia bacterium]